MLEEVLPKLPFRSRAELKHRIASLDVMYLDRTLPDPFAARRQWRAYLWWRRRLTAGGEAM
ncbi:hypothetical protein ACFYO9_11150 [Streptomyces sp. NPDC005863]|uniref:hypothetical protein n=1 Tax=unclassified Streptomyces TaxID=2593676 RepID=UPI0033C321AE